MTVHKDENFQYKTLKIVLGEIEAVRMKRQREYADQSHPLLKRFTQQELNDEACPTYKNLLVGRSRRVPDRQTIIQIAEYLECNSDERNDLLLAAEYLPIHHELEGRSLELALEHAQQIMSNLPFPAMIVTHTLDIKGLNEPFRHLFDIPFDSFMNDKLNMADFHFNQDLPIRPRSTFDTASLEQWESHAIYGIQAFKRNNMYSRYDHWYKKLFNRFQKYDDINKYWNKQPKDLADEVEQSKTILARRDTSGELVPIRYKQIHLSVSSRMYPGIEVYLPVDDPAHRVFEYLGCPAECQNYAVNQ
ncbi:hypothetical protein P4H71_24135 [Paenibacillus kribbensis]|uniref:MmyB family transcriptional regulator n=1 Tax=Paenibacillus kribbensis TaxID=172713 RepID=UPI002DB856BA|nr:hypothetical protein [Paenibacillus kribbensis]MEC0237420.1 hypothetical protein [Paenibacillus kribbensis]